MQIPNTAPPPASPRLPCGRVLAALSAIALLITHRADASLYIAPPRVPDAMVAADSMRVAVIATCVRRSTPEAPALFRVDTLLWGVAWDSFTADVQPGPGGPYFIAGRKHLLLLRESRPPDAPSVRAAYPWREPADFEAWYGVGLDGFRGPDRATAVQLFEQLLTFRDMDAAERTATLESWAGPGSGVPDLAGETLRRHPECWAEPIRDVYLQTLRLRPSGQFAEFIGGHPDDATRREFVRMLREGGETRASALQLAVRDTTKWIRDSVTAIGRAIAADVDSVARKLGPEVFDYGSPRERRRIQTIMTIRGALAALDPGRPEERQILLQIARASPDWHGFRYMALARLRGDTSRVVRDLLWETIRGDQRNARNWISDLDPDPKDLTLYWTEAELYRALGDTSTSICYRAIQEAGRRRDRRAGKWILAQLRAECRPSGEPPLTLSTHDRMEALGAIGLEDAVPDLIRWSSSSESRLAIAARQALVEIGDPRALNLFRELSRVRCSGLDRQEASQVTSALARFGTEEDLPTLETWFRECPTARMSALYAIGCIGGPSRMLQTMLSHAPGPLSPDDLMDYERLEARVRETRGAD